ncbi:MAG: hypothetical protein ACI4AQ_00560 [Lachnospiraceae bacterium]
MEDIWISKMVEKENMIKQFVMVAGGVTRCIKPECVTTFGIGIQTGAGIILI